ncbi:MAG: T9SS type A sorting domain-containing protein [Bacteroidia bacterium]|nr:T9SS type A sorting domain-containing protein [Bacteroidia bacterium]
MINRFLTLLLILSALSSNAQVFTVDTIAFNGNPNNRINLLILGDGYTTGEMSTFRNDATTVSNYFFSVPPFSLYADFFNVFAIEVVSNESGTDHPETASDCNIGSQPITSVDNYLETTFDYGNTHRCIYSSQGGLVYSIANTNFPLYDFVNVIVNTSYYGGCAGGIAYTSMHSASPEVFVHEFGHMFGDLADEYDSSDPCSAGSSQNINVTQETDPTQIVWKDWLTTAPIPTPAGTNCGLIGLYEGAQYCATNWYRPKCNCKMRSLNQPFCEVCFEQLIFKVNSMVNYIETSSPSNSTTLQLCKNATQNFSASVLNSSNNTVRSQWLVDNVVVVNNSTNFTLNPASLSTGIHQVKLITYDTTLQVKKAMTPYQVLWTVNVRDTAVAVASSNDTEFCTGQTLNLSATGVGTFTWAGPNSYTSSSQNPTISGLTASQSGVYTVTASNSCGTTSSSVNITVSSSVNASITSQGPATFCSGNFVVLDAGSASGRTFQWYRNASPISGATGNVYSAAQTGSYTVLVTITGTSCTATSAPLVVTVNPAPGASISTTDPTVFCQGDSALLQAQTGTGYSYQWFRNSQIIATGTSSQLNALTTGAYTVVTSIGSCSDTSSGISIVVNPVPANAITIQGDTVFCAGDQVDLVAVTCGNCTYQWKQNFTNIGGANSNSYAVSQSGSYNIEITDNGNGCSSSSRQVIVDVLPIPIAVITTAGDSIICDGDSVVLSAPAGAGYFYVWFKDSQPLNDSLQSISVNTTGSYIVEVNNIVCSSQSDPFSLTVNNLPIVNLDPLPDTVCVYNSSIALSGSPFGGTYSGNGVADSSFSPASAGAGLQTISYTYMDSNGCEGLVIDSVFVDICLSTKTLTEQFDFIVFPNPVSGMATLYYSLPNSAIVDFVFMDIAGRIVERIHVGQSVSGENSINVNTTTFSAGVYFLEMRFDGRVLAKKMIVAR